jgi:DNA ligase D-like protein (predicted polymerase)
MNAEYVEISHPEKELYPHEHLSKQDVADYYERVSPYMIPHISERPLTFKRYPKGIDDKGFFNKHAPDHFPDYIKRIDVKMRSGKKEVMQMASADETADLVYFAGQNVIEIHIGLSRADKLEKPDQLIFDFDPSDGDFEKVRTAALKLKDILDEFELPSFIKTTGSKGVHVHITALAAQYVVGALLLLGGAMRLVNAFRFPRGRWWRSISGVLFIAAGGAMIWWPLIGLSALILAIGALLVVEGVLDILLALTYRPAKRWGWLLAAGIASIILGFLIYAGFPLTGVIYLALAIGISMGVYGASILLLAVNAGQEHEKEKAGAAS